MELLGERLTNQEIAAKLSLSLNSVKWYTQQIFRKLGVNNRRQAIALGAEIQKRTGSGAVSLSASQASSDQSDLAALRPKHNLPVHLNAFIEREKELAEVRELLENHRLVTLTGSGGVGKTRLAEQAAQEALDTFPAGVWLVGFAPLSDSALLPQAVGGAVGIQKRGDTTVLDMLLDYFRNKTILLVFDNCEHLVVEIAILAEKLLQACPGLSILASSREILGVPGEATYRVPSMAYPKSTSQPTPEELAGYASVRLFAERAAAANPQFVLTAANAEPVAQIARRLDGIPLAIELAAARTGVLSVEQIATRLNDRFHLLTGGSRTAVPRQQTLLASLDWSYSLLTDKERLLLIRLSIFSSGWTLEAAEQVCAFGGLVEFEVLDLLTSLINKSMVTPMPGDHDAVGWQENRYILLETIRQYAAERLADEKQHDKGIDGKEHHHDGEILRHRYLDYYHRWAGEANIGMRGSEQMRWSKRIQSELDNVRPALEWAISSDLPGRMEEAIEVATRLVVYWQDFGFPREGCDWLENGLARLPDDAANEGLRASTLMGIAMLKNNLNVNALDYVEEPVRFYRSQQNFAALSEALALQARAYYFFSFF